MKRFVEQHYQVLRLEKPAYI